MLRGKFIALNVYNRKKKKFHINLYSNFKNYKKNKIHPKQTEEHSKEKSMKFKKMAL